MYDEAGELRSGKFGGNADGLSGERPFEQSWMDGENYFCWSMTIPPPPCLLAFSFLVAMVLSTQLSAVLRSAARARRIVALVVSALTVHKVHVGHGVVVVLAKLEGFVEQADAFLDDGSIVLLYQVAGLFVLEQVGGLHAEFVALFLTEFVGLGPVDKGDRVVGFRIVGIDLDSFVVVLLGLVEAASPGGRGRRFP